ncbi:MAG TPA: 50S ribosomal protein L4 [Patescibacteria group bacterium]|nr:50S ribosomal protein L4 [Patescibacteria group bacterium]
MAETKVKKTTEKKVTKTVKPAATTTKKVVKTDVVKAEVAVEKSATPKKSLSLDVYGTDGKVVGKVSVSATIFGAEVNKVLIAQAVRVYLANQRQGNASTKTRGEVDGSTAKIYRQKGTGRARHGSKRAPIFVKGGIVFGPKPRDFGLNLSTKMKRKALFSALSARVADKTLTVVDGFESLEAKTKKFVAALTKLGLTDKKQSLLLVTDSKAEKVKRAGKNVAGVSFAGAMRLNTYDVLKNKRLVIMKEALEEIEKTFLK